MKEQIDITSPDYVTVISTDDRVYFSIRKTHNDGIVQKWEFTFPKGVQLPKLDKSKVLIKKIKRSKPKS
tara:strand:- start:316 stop:522 length:207 start_codon:yes stop_codon:yes gene_type:complete